MVRSTAEKFGGESLSSYEYEFEEDWVDHFGNVSHRVLPRVVSDHCPLLVVAGSVNKGQSAF